MNRFLNAWFLCGLLFASAIFVKAQDQEKDTSGYQPLVLSDAVIPVQSQDPLTDPRIFNPEFYRKFNPELALSTNAEALSQWTSGAANHCLRASFNFFAADYLNRYPDLGLQVSTPGACDAAILQFVTRGFNQGKIGAFDSYPIVFDFNFYVDAANNPDLSSDFSNGSMDQVDIEIHWLKHGIGERRAASPFFSIKEYQECYSDAAAVSPRNALRQYVAQGQAQGRLGKKDWADPSEWRALVDELQQSVVTAEPNDLVRSFTGADGKETTVIVKSPKWFRGPDEPLPSTVHVCDVPPPSGNNDWKVLTKFLTPAGIKPGCDVVRLSANSAYHLVLPQNQPSSQDYVLNHLPHLQINNAQDFVFDGNGSTLYFTGATTGIDVFNSQRVVIENLKIDWGNSVDPHPLWRGPLFSAFGAIVPDGSGSAHIALDADTVIPPGFVPYIYAFNLWDRKTNEIATDDFLNTGPGDQGCDITCIQSHGQQNPSQQSMLLRNRSLFPANNPAGQFVAASLAQFPNRAVVVRFQRFIGEAIELDYLNSDIRVIHTTVHTAPYIGITSGQLGRGIALEDVHATPSQGRPFTSIADGFHVAGMSGDVVVENSSFEREGDDAMNITSTWDVVTAVSAPDSLTMNGTDANPNPGDTLAFVDEAMGYLGSAKIVTVGPANLPPWPIGPVMVGLDSSPPWLRPGIHAINLNHVPSRVYISGVDIHDKLGRGILVGGFHMLIQKSSFTNITGTAILSVPSSFFSESAGAADIAIRNNKMVHTVYVPKAFQDSSDGTNTYPNRNASIAMFEDMFSAYNGVSNEVTGIYPTFQDIEVSGNDLDSVTGTGIYLTGTKNVEINSDRFTGCAAVPDADPFYSYYGSDSKSAVVLSFADTVSLVHDETTNAAGCTARTDDSSSKDIGVESGQWPAR